MMDFKTFMISNELGKKSATLTAFVMGSIVVNFKLLFSGMTIAGFTLAPFAGSEYALCFASLGSIYVLRKNVGKSEAASVVSGEEAK